MFKNKRLLALATFLACLFCAPNASAMEEQKETAYKNLLWSSLENTTLETELSQKQLNAYAKILTWIHRDNPKIFDATRNGFTPQEFAMYRCHHLIGTAIDRLLKPKHTSYKPMDVEKKKRYVNLRKKNIKSHVETNQYAPRKSNRHMHHFFRIQ